ncbi:MAG: CRISPR-associated endonuclease Cas1 [Methanomicrobiales archaeon]|jgi:CRISPR-associated endonuclease Cas1|nr:CRISPR-associated endonuclease Cas1 [Methanomicrobiales archaeon]
MSEFFSWKVITGNGAHIKASSHTLRINQHGAFEEIPLADLDHLLLYGGHVLHTSALSNLIHADIFISFYTTAGELVGTIIPPSYSLHTDTRAAQLRRTEHPFDLAKEFAYAAMQERIQTIEWYEQEWKVDQSSLLRAGEMDILYQALHEIEYLIKIDELRRVHRLVHDMYYEIYARLVDPVLAFRRRTSAPYQDPVNLMLALGYTMISSNIFASLQGAFLDPDEGLLHSGHLGLVRDMTELHKTHMIDIPLKSFLKDDPPSDKDIIWDSQQCSLSNTFISDLTKHFYESIEIKKIDARIKEFATSIRSNEMFFVR